MASKALTLWHFTCTTPTSVLSPEVLTAVSDSRPVMSAGETMFDWGKSRPLRVCTRSDCRCLVRCRCMRLGRGRFRRRACPFAERRGGSACRMYRIRLRAEHHGCTVISHRTRYSSEVTRVGSVTDGLAVHYVSSLRSCEARRKRQKKERKKRKKKENDDTH